MLPSGKNHRIKYVEENVVFNLNEPTNCALILFIESSKINNEDCTYTYMGPAVFRQICLLKILILS